MRNTLLLILLIVLVGSGAAFIYNASAVAEPKHNHDLGLPEVKELTEYDREVIYELRRLENLNEQQILEEGDFAYIEKLMAGDHDAEHLAEIKTLVKHGETEHAAHGFGFLIEHMQSGLDLTCPSHALAHYYVFTKEGETALAEENLDEAKDTLEGWIPAAREYDTKFPSEVNLDEAIRHIKDDLAQIEEGNTTISQEELDFLTYDASLCI